MSRFNKLVLLPVLALLASCSQQTFRSQAELYQWINEPENGLVQERYINQTHLKVNYLPADIQVMRELEAHPQSSIDSLQALYNNAYSFVLSIGPDNRNGKSGSDIMQRGNRSYEDYRDRFMTMNFNIGEHLSLRAGDLVLKPTLALTENVYGLQQDCKINLVFAPADEAQQRVLQAHDLELVFDDRVFDTGWSRFVITQQHLNSIPAVQYAQR